MLNMDNILNYNITMWKIDDFSTLILQHGNQMISFHCDIAVLNMDDIVDCVIVILNIDDIHDCDIAIRKICDILDWDIAMRKIYNILDCDMQMDDILDYSMTLQC